MFAGFNLEINKHFFESKQKSFQEYQKIGEEHLGAQGEGIENALSEYINNNIVDGSKIQKDWFPEVEADIFYIIALPCCRLHRFVLYLMHQVSFLTLSA